MAFCRAIASFLRPAALLLVLPYSCRRGDWGLWAFSSVAMGYRDNSEPRWVIPRGRAVEKFKWLVNHGSNAISLVSLFATPVWSDICLLRGRVTQAPPILGGAGPRLDNRRGCSSRGVFTAAGTGRQPPALSMPTRAGNHGLQKRSGPRYTARSTNGGEGGAEPRHGGTGPLRAIGDMPVAFLNTRLPGVPGFFFFNRLNFPTAHF